MSWRCYICGEGNSRGQLSTTHYDCRVALNRALDNLSRAVAIAGALCRSFELGCEFGGYWGAVHAVGHRIIGELPPEPWCPNAEGDPT